MLRMKFLLLIFRAIEAPSMFSYRNSSFLLLLLLIFFSPPPLFFFFFAANCVFICIFCFSLGSVMLVIFSGKHPRKCIRSATATKVVTRCRNLQRNRLHLNERVPSPLGLAGPFDINGVFFTRQKSYAIQADAKSARCSFRFSGAFVPCLDKTTACSRHLNSLTRALRSETNH